MSAIKYRGKVAFNKPVNDGAAVEHRVEYRGFKIEVTNFPGSRTLMWRIVRIGSEFATCGSEDRYEHTVASLKDMTVAKVDRMADAIAAKEKEAA